MKEKVMNGLEKFSKAMLSPLSYISAAGLILVLGALLTSTSLSAMIPALQWTPIKLLGQLIYNCIMVIINNLSLMFCVGIAAALAKKNKQQAAIIGLMSYFMYLTAGNVTLTQLGMLAEADPMVGLYGTGQSTVFGIQTVDMGVFGGLLQQGFRLFADAAGQPTAATARRTRTCGGGLAKRGIDHVIGIGGNWRRVVADAEEVTAEEVLEQAAARAEQGFQRRNGALLLAH